MASHGYHDLVAREAIKEMICGSYVLGCDIAYMLHKWHGTFTSCTIGECVKDGICLPDTYMLHLLIGSPPSKTLQYIDDTLFNANCF